MIQSRHILMLKNVGALNDISDADLVNEIAKCETSYDILRLAREITKQHGYDFFSIARLPTGDERFLSNLSIVSNWPPELVSTFDQLGLLDDCSIFEGLRKSTRPLVWNLEDVADVSSGQKGAMIFDLFSTFGLKKGVFFSTHEPSGRRGTISFSGTRDAPTDAEMMELSYLSNLLYERVVEIRAPTQAPEQLLSVRERECLVWTSAGKTSAEIAAILELSEHTVNHYLSAACQKLGAVNRAHAVAKSIRSGLLD